MPATETTIEKTETLPIPAEWMVNDVSHSKAENGLAVVKYYPNEWARVVRVGRDKIENQFFLVWTKLCTQGNPMSPQVLGLVQDVQQKLQSGAATIKNTRLVEI